MMRRRFVNLVTISYAECAYSVRRMDPYKHLFYQSAKAAIEAAADEAPTMEEGRRLQTLQLPHSQMNLAATDCGGTLDTFALFRPRCGQEGRIIYFNRIGEAGLYDADKHLHHTLGILNDPKAKGTRPVCLSMAPHPGAKHDSMYVLRRNGANGGRCCFEVLEPLPNPTLLSNNWVTPNWRWRLLPPPPPFIRSQPGYTPSAAYTTAVNGSNGCSTIYVSFNGGVGTYRFETARPDPSSHQGWSPSEEWSYVGPWRLPFHGRAHYVPEFNLCFGFSDEFSSPNHLLCAVDLSAIAIDDGGEQGPPRVLQVGRDLNLPDKDYWIPVHFELVNLGDGKFLIARIFEIEATSEQFAILTGIEMMAGAADDQSLKVVKHKCARYDFGDHSINWVL